MRLVGLSYIDVQGHEQQQQQTLSLLLEKTDMEFVSYA